MVIEEISKFVDLSMRRLKKNKKHCFKTLLKADKTVFFVLVMMKPSVNEGFISF